MYRFECVNMLCCCAIYPAASENARASNGLLGAKSPHRLCNLQAQAFVVARNLQAIDPIVVMIPDGEGSS